MALPHVFRIVTQVRVDDRVCTFGTTWNCTNGYDALLSAAACTNAWSVDILPLLLAIMSEGATFEGLYGYGIQPNVNLTNRWPANSTPGDRSGDPVPSNLCAVVSLQVDDPTAERHGRAYIPGLSKDDLTTGIWTAAFTAGALTDFAEALASPISADGQDFSPVVIQRISGGAPVGPNAMEVVSSRVTQIPFTQRRRTSRQFGTKG